MEIDTFPHQAAINKLKREVIMDIVHYVKSDNYTKIRVLEVLRLACEIPQKSVADALGRSTSLLSMLENGTRQLPKDEAEDILRKYSECIDRELGIDSTYSIINQMCRYANVKGAVRQLDTKQERLFAKSRILHEFAKRLRVE